MTMIDLKYVKGSAKNVHIDSILSVEFIPGIHEDFKCGDSLILIHSLLHGSYKRYILNNLFFEQLECFKRLRGCHQWILRTKLSLYEHSWHFLLHTSSPFDGRRKSIISFVELPFIAVASTYVRSPLIEITTFGRRRRIFVDDTKYEPPVQF